MKLSNVWTNTEYQLCLHFISFLLFRQRSLNREQQHPRQRFYAKEYLTNAIRDMPYLLFARTATMQKILQVVVNLSGFKILGEEKRAFSWKMDCFHYFVCSQRAGLTGAHRECKVYLSTSALRIFSYIYSQNQSFFCRLIKNIRSLFWSCFLFYLISFLHTY